MGKRGQLAVEYIILISFVVLITLVTIAFLGYMPGVNNQGSLNTAKAYWATVDVGFEGWAIDREGDINLLMINNKRSGVDISNVTLDNTVIYNGSKHISSGGNLTIEGNVGSKKQGEYEYSVKIEYFDSVTDKTHLFVGRHPLIGMVTAMNLSGVGFNATENTTTILNTTTTHFTWIIELASDFDLGFYTNTYSNGDQVELSAGQTKGYYSRIFNSNYTNTTWNNISFVEGLPYKEELPDNQGVESVSGGMNMTGNMVLLHFDEQSAATSFNDTSDNGRTFSCSTCPTSGSGGKFNTGLDFNGGGQYLEDSDGENYINGLSEFTLAVWVKSDVTNTDKGILIAESPVGNDDVLTVRYDKSGYYGGGTQVIKAGVTVSGSVQQMESSNYVQKTEWQHIVLTWKSGDPIRLYLDGELDTPTYNQSPSTGTISDSTGVYIGVGAKDSLGSVGWDGKIDELAFWNRTLSAAEILSLYKRGAMNLSLNYRGCDDAACNGESWQTQELQNTSVKLFAVTGQYFQVNATLLSTNETLSPILYNISVGYNSS